MDLKQEKKLWDQGYKIVAGLDEAGRGALCGPVVAAAVVLKNPKSTRSFDSGCAGRMTGQIPKELREVNDSKKLTPKKREELYEILIDHPFIEWGIGRAGPKVIDRINILEATKLAMERAVKNLKSKVESPWPRSAKRGGRRPKVDFIILDGRIDLDLKTLRQAQGGERSRTIAQESIVEADGKVFSCAAASVIAKVVRDKAMKVYHRKYPQYGFIKHKGYGTEFHRKMLKKYGPCKIHRRSFKPIKATNSKSQYLNLKQIQMTKIQNSK